MRNQGSLASESQRFGNEAQYAVQRRRIKEFFSSGAKT